MVKMVRPRVQELKPRARPATVKELVRPAGSTWMRRRAAVLEAAHGLCALCQAQGRLTLAAEVDHIHELADGGADTDDNLQALCIPCHRAKSLASRSARSRSA